MKARALAFEMRQAFVALRPNDRRELLDYGVHARDIDCFQMVGRAKIQRRGDHYEPDTAGRWAYVTPVLALWPESPETPDPDVMCRFGNIIDLLAWHPDRPNRWATRTGNGESLGAIEPQLCEPNAVPVWRSPLNWFRAGCRGLVILSRNQSSAYRILACCIGGILAEDEPHNHQIKWILNRSFLAPTVRVMNSGKQLRHAA
jgi:hypothetical protein